MIKNISVLGAGTMGHGIANVFAMAGYQVSLYESVAPVREAVMGLIEGELEFMVQEGYLELAKVNSTLSNIKLFDSLQEAVVDADFVVEAVPEDLKLKQDLFKQLDGICQKHTVFASNTSSIPLKEMIQFLPKERQAKTMVCHWYNPAHLIPIVELSHFGNMEEDIFEEIYQLHAEAGKQPVKVKKDIPGLIANRLLHALAREAFYLMEIEAAPPEDIDRALKYGPGFRSATTGILEVADMGGLDIWCTVEDNLFKELCNASSASEYMRDKVQHGNLGIKTGEGFYSYPEETRMKVRNDFNKRLLTQLIASKKY